MRKNIFVNDPLLGKAISPYIGLQNKEGMIGVLSVVEKYFYKKVYASVNTNLHEASPVCSYAIFPIQQKKETWFMLSIENGYLTTLKGEHIIGDSIGDLSEKFFKIFLKEGVNISFETYLSFYLKHPKGDGKSLVAKRRQSCQITFTLVYISGKDPLIYNLSAKRFKWLRTSEEDIK